MKIVVDRQLLDGIQKVIAPKVECIPLDDYSLDPSPPEVDGLVIRSVTKVQKETFPKWVHKPPSFVITATAGIDHLDVEWLNSLGIEWRHCPGANAHSVAEYVIASLLWMSQGAFPGTLGIIGVGATGQAVESLAQALDWPVVLFDPPRERAEKGLDGSVKGANPFQSAKVEDIMACDAVTIHVPRIMSGEDATYPLWGYEELQKAKASWIIQASRGGTIDENALSDWAKSGGQLACDVWDGEPSIRQDLLNASTLATPHIAGYSVQSRHQAFIQAAKHLESFGVPVQDSTPALSGEAKAKMTLSDDLTTSQKLIESIHPWMALSSMFKMELLNSYSQAEDPSAQANPRHQKELFKKWRTQTPLREEFSRYNASNELQKAFPWLMKVGVQTASEH